jgi:hypothetical protein
LTLAPGLARAYRATRYQVAGQRFTIGRRSRAIDGVLAGMHTREAVLLTADNPHSRRRPDAVNARMMRRLHAALRGHTAFQAESGEGHWREAQFLVACPAAWAAPLARRFGQNAIVLLRAGQAPALRVLV